MREGRAMRRGGGRGTDFEIRSGGVSSGPGAGTLARGGVRVLSGGQGGADETEGTG